MGRRPGEEVLEAEVAEWKNLAMRATADLDNFRKRISREKEEALRYANRGLLEELLPILDNFERAMAAPSGSGAEQALREGLVLIYRQLSEALRKEGLRSIDAVGQPFDPNLHEAVATDHESGLPSQTVVEEMRRGYLLRGRVLRPALVKVAVDPPESENCEEPPTTAEAAPTKPVERVDDPTLGFLDTAQGFGEAGEE